MGVATGSWLPKTLPTSCQILTLRNPGHIVKLYEHNNSVGGEGENHVKGARK